MVTREEEHSTRGRANLMRSVLSGHLDERELSGARLHDALDLCLECKACKAECPSNVDMAKLKYEFLAQYNATNFTPIRSLLFAHVHHLSRAAARWPRTVNRMNASPFFRNLLERFLGIDCRRKLPPIAIETFEEWFLNRSPQAQVDRIPNGRVVLFHDTFMNFSHPEIGQATTRLLEAAGYEVQLAQRVCCGRPMISKGFAESARSHAVHNLAELLRWVNMGYSIVGCEPSCLLTFRDEYHDLLEGPSVRTLSDACFLLDEFIDRETRAGRWKLEFPPPRRRLILHTHCHQKALVGSSHLKSVLGAAYEVSEIDSGCCGMAGAFGYETEHYDISLRVGERRLFPAVNQETEALVVAPGVSCRQQIQDVTGRRTLHPAEALWQALEG
jgi:Fe-S oxidoreductase